MSFAIAMSSGGIEFEKLIMRRQVFGVDFEVHEHLDERRGGVIGEIDYRPLVCQRPEA